MSDEQNQAQDPSPFEENALTPQAGLVDGETETETETDPADIDNDEEDLGNDDAPVEDEPLEDDELPVKR